MCQLVKFALLKLIFLAEHLREDWVGLRITEESLMENSLQCEGVNTLEEETLLSQDSMSA